MLAIFAGVARADGENEAEPELWAEPELDPVCELWMNRASGYSDDGEEVRPKPWRGALATVSRMGAATAQRVRACLPLKAIARDTWAVSTGEPGDPYAQAIVTRSIGRWELVVFDDGRTLTLDAPRPESPIGRALDHLLDGRATTIPGAPACGELRPGQPCAVFSVPISDEVDEQLRLVAAGLRRALGHEWLVVDRAHEAQDADDGVSGYDFIAAPWSKRRGATITVRGQCDDVTCSVLMTVTPRARR